MQIINIFLFINFFYVLNYFFCIKFGIFFIYFKIKFLYKRNNLIKKNTLYIYLHRNHFDILRSYEKAKKRGYYLGWEEYYSKFTILFPNINNCKYISMFNHKVWKYQSSFFPNSLTLSYESFKKHSKFIKWSEREKIIEYLKQIDKTKKNITIKLDNKINFNIFELMYFKIRRCLDSRKRSVVNY